MKASIIFISIFTNRGYGFSYFKNMNLSRFTFLCIAVCLGSLASCSAPSSASSPVPSSSSAGRDSALASQVFTEVNSYRTANGKAALSRHAGLDRLAQQHSDYLAKTGGSYDLYGKNVSHFGFDGRAVMARQAYKITSMGENVIASTDRSAKRLVNSWVASKGHDYNMRNDWFCTGVGTTITPDGMGITTQIFGTAPSTFHRESTDRFNRR